MGRERKIPCLMPLNMGECRIRLAGKSPKVVPRPVRDLAETCRGEGRPVVDPRGRVFNHRKENDPVTTAVWIADTDSHTKPIGPNFVAEEPPAVIEEAGLRTEDLMERHAMGYPVRLP